MALRRGRPGPSHDLFPGYTDVVEIGAGRLATVYRAREVATGRAVALRLPSLRSLQALESFERDSAALGALGAHPHVLTLYRTFRAPDARPVLVLELCSGAVCERLGDGQALDVRDAVALGIKIAGALETAHRAGFVHGDVRARHILLTGFDEPVLAGFGAASPRSASAVADVFGLASSLCQLVGGQPAPGPDVVPRLSELLARATAEERPGRPATAARFAAELAEVEAAQGWPRTRFLVRDGAAGPGVVPVVPRVPEPEPAARVLPAVPEPAPAPEPVPVPEPAPTPVLLPVLRAAVPIDEDLYEPLHDDGPDAPPEPARYPIPPAAHASRPAGYRPSPGPAESPESGGDVPVWVRRTPSPGPVVAPRLGGDLAVDPRSLRPRLTVRAGLARLTVDERQLRTGTLLRRQRLSWLDVYAFEPMFAPGEQPTPAAPGMLAAVTATGLVPLPATRRAGDELRRLHALLDAYRVRASGGAWSCRATSPG